MKRARPKLITIWVIIGYVALLLSVIAGLILTNQNTRNSIESAGFMIPEVWAINVGILFAIIAAICLYQIWKMQRSGLYALSLLTIIGIIFGIITHQINLLGILLKLTYMAVFYLKESQFN